MQTGNLTVYLQLQEGLFPVKRIAEQSLGSLPKNGKLFFVGFSESEEEAQRNEFPPSAPVVFLPMGADFFSSKHKELFSIVPKVVIFKQLVPGTAKFKKLLDIIVELLALGNTIFATAALDAFISKEDEDTSLIPTSFYKYIGRVIVIPSEKKMHNDLFSAALTLSTHIKNENFKHQELFHPQYTSKIVSSPKTIWSFFIKNIYRLGVFIDRKAPSLRSKKDGFVYNLFRSLLNNLIALFFIKTLYYTTGIPFFGTAALLISLILIINRQLYTFSAAIIAFLAFNIILFYFYPFILKSAKELSLYHLVLLLTLPLLGYLIGDYSKHLKKSYKNLQKDLKHLHALFSYTETLASCVNDDAIIKSSKQYFLETLDIEIVLLLSPRSTSYTANDSTTSSEFDTPPPALSAQYSNFDFLPLASDSITLGYIGLNYPKDINLVDNNLLRTSVMQLKLALQRLRLSQSYQLALVDNEKEQLRSVILSSISHDLKTPLTTIIGSCTALEELPNLSENNRSSLIRGIHEASEQLNQSISNILESSRLSADNILKNNKSVYLDDVINTVLKRMKRSLKLMNVTLNIPTPEKSAIQGDPTLIQQVFFNLIDNASKHTPIGGEIAIHVATTPDLVITKIFDDGPGVEPSRRNVIFDKFYRFQHTDHKKAGTGLGLAICKQVIEAHKGKIWISDRDDLKRGAQFNVELPRSHSNYT